MVQVDPYKSFSAIYIATNKCANTSFKHLLKKYFHVLIPHNNIKHKPQEYNLYYIKNLPIWNSCFKFTTVRHPISRFLSSVNFFYGYDFLSKHTKSIDSILDIVEDDSCDFDLNRNPCFFIKRHTLPLTHPHYCLLKDDKLDIDYFLKLEMLDTEYKNLCDKIGILYEPLPKINQSKKIFDYTALDTNHIKRIQQIYRKDFEIFGYET